MGRGVNGCSRSPCRFVMMGECRTGEQCPNLDGVLAQLRVKRQRRGAIPAWGIAPGSMSSVSHSAEGAIHAEINAVLQCIMGRAFSPLPMLPLPPEVMP